MFKCYNKYTKCFNRLIWISFGVIYLTILLGFIGGLAHATTFNTKLSGVVTTKSVSLIVLALNTAKQGDTVIINIDSPGGDEDAVQILLMAMWHTKATITTKVTRLAASAAAMVLMNGNQIQISPYALILFHTGSTCDMGGFHCYTTTEKSAPGAYYFALYVWADCCKRFMTDEEWVRLKMGQDIWYSGDTLLHRQAE